MSHQLKTIVQKPIIQDGKRVTKNVVAPFHQQRKSYHMPTIETIPLNDWPSNAVLSGNTRIRSQIPRGSFQNCSNASLRLDVSVNNTSSVVLTDIFHFFNKIEIRAGGSGEILQTIYSDSLLFQYLLAVNNRQFNHSAESLNFNSRVYQAGRNDSLPAGSIKSFYLPLLNSIFSADLEWDKIQQDIILECYVSSGSPVLSGTGSITSAAFLVIESRDHSKQPDTKLSVGDAVHSHTYLDVVQVAKYGQSMPASTQYLLPLDSVIGSCPMILCNFSQAGTNDNNRWWSSTDVLGRNGLVNLLSPNSEGLLGNSHIQAQVLRDETMTKQMKNDLLANKTGYLVIPFSENLAASSAGSHAGGCMHFKQDRLNLMFQPPSNKVNQIMTIVVDNAAILTGGQYRIRIGNEYTSWIPFNATVATVKTAVESLKIVNSNGITVTLSSALSAASSSTLTIQSPSYIFQEGEISVDSNSETGSAVPTGLSIFTSTPAVVGTNGQYDINCYVYVYKTVYQNRGKITSSVDAY
jgi:hypothetical protein